MNTLTLSHKPEEFARVTRNIEYLSVGDYFFMGGYTYKLIEHFSGWCEVLNVNAMVVLIMDYGTEVTVLETK